MKVEVTVLDSPSLMVLMVSVDVKQNSTGNLVYFFLGGENPLTRVFLPHPSVCRYAAVQ